jgi:hypothetical protein
MAQPAAGEDDRLPPLLNCAARGGVPTPPHWVPPGRHPPPPSLPLTSLAKGDLYRLRQTEGFQGGQRGAQDAGAQHAVVSPNAGRIAVSVRLLERGIAKLDVRVSGGILPFVPQIYQHSRTHSVATFCKTLSLTNCC